MHISKKDILSIFLVLLFSYSQFSDAGTMYKVKPTDSLSRISNKFYKSSKLSDFQKYIAILAENPDAFRYGNINFLKSGQTLNLPDADQLLAMELTDAKRLVAEHNNKAKSAKKGNIVKISPPFENYTPKNIATDSETISELASKQQAASKDLERMNSESEALSIRLEQLNADKNAMDAEINQLDSLIKQ